MSAEKARHVRAPAGLNIGAKSPEEIAVSVLAEIIQMRANAAKAAAQPKPSAGLPVINLLSLIRKALKTKQKV